MRQASTRTTGNGPNRSTAARVWFLLSAAVRELADAGQLGSDVEAEIGRRTGGRC